MHNSSINAYHNISVDENKTTDFKPKYKKEQTRMDLVLIKLREKDWRKNPSYKKKKKLKE